MPDGVQDEIEFLAHNRLVGRMRSPVRLLRLRSVLSSRFDSFLDGLEDFLDFSGGFRRFGGRLLCSRCLPAMVPRWFVWTDHLMLPPKLPN